MLPVPIAAAGAPGLLREACDFPLTQRLRLSEGDLAEEYRPNYKQKLWD